MRIDICQPLLWEMREDREEKGADKNYFPVLSRKEKRRKQKKIKKKRRKLKKHR
jgi:hypothetical protein